MAPVVNLLLLPLLLLGGAQAAPVRNNYDHNPSINNNYSGSGNFTSPHPPAHIPLRRRLVRRQVERRLPTGWSYTACVSESSSDRLLSGFTTASEDMTPRMCISECADRGYSHAAIENGIRCYCASGFTGDGGTIVEDTTCNVPCAGSASEMCGSTLHLSVFSHTGASSCATDVNKLPSATPSASESSLPSESASASVEASATASSEPVPSASISTSASASNEPSATPSTDPTVSASVEPSTSASTQATASPSASASTEPSASSSLTEPTASASAEPTAEPSETPSTETSATPSAEPSTLPSPTAGSDGPAPVPTPSASEEPSASVSAEPSTSASPTAGSDGPAPTISPTASASAEPSPSQSTTISSSAEPSPTPSPTVEPEPSTTPSPSAEPSTASPSPSAESSTASPSPSAEPSTASPSPSAESTATPSPSAESSTASPSPTPEPSSASPSPTVEPSPTASSSPTPSASGTPDSNVLTTSPEVPPSDEPHYVWAHFMLGNTYPFTPEIWESDIALAASHSIDGFALNLGPEQWQSDQMAAAYAAAEKHGNFKMFASFDFAVMPCSNANDAQTVMNLIKKFASSPAQAKYDDKILVSTFLGESCTFGGSDNSMWETAVFLPLQNEGINVYFVPFFSHGLDTAAVSKWVDGGLDWNSAWPMGNYNIDSGQTGTDYIQAFSTKNYMSAVSPFFYTHFGKDTFDKNWLYRSDDWLYCTRWEQIIAKRTHWTMTEILTWNDWGESSYIGEIKPAFPATSETWVEGLPHTALGPLTKYYSTAFKEGAYPPIEQDSIVMWSRPHAALADATNDPVGKPRGFDFSEDSLYAAVLTTAPAEVTLTSGSSTATFSVPAGLSKIKIPSAEGAIGGTIVRDGATVASYDSGDAFQWTRTPERYNYNYFVGGSSEA